jgi:PAS domain S-box-containing protein
MITADRAAEREQAQTRLDDSEQRFRLLVESVKEYAIFMLDPTGRVATWNAGAERINGYSAAEIIGHHFSRFYPVDDVRVGKCEMELEGAIRDGRFEDEGWRVRKDGTRLWANVVITALWGPQGELVGFAKVTRDLTERRRAEQERLRLAQAQEAIRLRDEFLSIVSHELKTPLAALQLQLENLRQRTRERDGDLSPRIDKIVRSGDRLGDLIESLLDVSRIATGKLALNRERFDLAEALAPVIESLSVSAEKSGCSLQVQLQPGLRGVWDRVRLEQVLTNLLSNAIKYGGGAPIDVSLAAEGDQAVLQVSDRGPGIPEAERSQIFGRFERSASLRHYGGLGVGLYVCREVVQAHGGSISVDNRPEGGARFSVRLPLRDPSNAPPDQERAP